MVKRYVLAYSGGLDTSVILKWLQTTHSAEVITVTANLGQNAELSGIEDKALACGATDAVVADLREEFVSEFVWPTLKAGALYQDVYPLATAIGRPLIARLLTETARSYGASAIVHGCTAKGNDQVRIEVGVGCLAPELECIAPLRTWELKTREEEIDFAAQHGIPVLATKSSPYSIDQNLWGVSIEAGDLENAWSEPPSDCWQITTNPEEAPDVAEYVTISFEAGIPVAVNGIPFDAVELIRSLNETGAAHGVGRIDMIEDRLVGIKSREVYEAPAAVILHTAREALEQLTLDRETRRVKGMLARELSRLVYDGLWFTPLREAISQFVDSTVQNVTGEVKLKLFKGSAFAVGRISPKALYAHDLATYGTGDRFNHASAEGFIDLFGLGAKVAASRTGAAAEALEEIEAKS